MLQAVWDAQKQTVFKVRGAAQSLAVAADGTPHARKWLAAVPGNNSLTSTPSSVKGRGKRGGRIDDE